MLASMPASHQRKPASSASAQLSCEQLERPLESPSARATQASDAERLRLPLGEPAGAAMAREALLGQLAYTPLVASAYGRVREPVQQDRNSAIVVELARDRKRRVPALLRHVELSERVRHAALDPSARDDQRAVGTSSAPSSSAVAHSNALGGQVRRPVVLERDDELEPELALAGLERPRERRSHVVALGDDEVVPLLPLGLGREVRRAAPARGSARHGGCRSADVLACRGELLGGELADRLEHPVARWPCSVHAAEEALVEQRLERVGVRIADGLGGLVAAAAGEDGERSKEPLLAPRRAGRTTTRSSPGASAGADRRRGRP